MKRPGTVYLIGAGPGDPGLLTVRAKELLSQSEVIIYDYLVNPKILDWAHPQSEIIYVGKKAGVKEMTQYKINKLLIKHSKTGKTVARLKGGDPFVFGRGGEEIEALSGAGISVEIVPGVSSISAVPAYAGIPLTHRDLASSFAVVTGHETPDKTSSKIAWDSLAQIGTLVLLMGYRNLRLNMNKLMDAGKNPDTPAAVISWGTLPNQNTVTGTVNTIADLVKQSKITASPAIVVVGDVVGLRDIANWYETKPLFGKTIVVTRAKEQAGEFADLLTEQGANVIEFPAIDIIPPRSWNSADKAIRNLESYNWLIFTSTNGVRSFFNRFRELGRDIRELHGIQIACIGEKTAETTHKYRLSVDAVPKDYRAEGLIDIFAKIDLSNQKILIPRAKEAREILPVKLREMGAKVDVVSFYEAKKPNKSKVAELKKMFRDKGIDCVTFASSSTTRNFIELLGRDKKLLKEIDIACIGPITAATVRELGFNPKIASKKHTIQNLTHDIVRLYGKVKKRRKR